MPTVDVAGVAIEVDLADPTVERIALDAMGVPEPERGRGPVHVTLLADDPQPLPARPPDDAAHGYEVWVEGERTVARWGAATARHDGDRVHLSAPGPADGAVPAPALRGLVHLVLTPVLAMYGRYLLHAAGIGSPDRALLVFGPSGAGKSTVAAAALRAGWSVLGDDLVVVREAAGVVVAHGVRQPLAVPLEATAALQVQNRPLGDARARQQVPAAVLQPGPVRVVAAATLRHSRSPTGELEPLPGTSVVSAVLQAAFPMPARHRRGLFAVAGALGRLPACTLGLAADPSARAAAVTSAVASWMPGLVSASA